MVLSAWFKKKNIIIIRIEVGILGICLMVIYRFVHRWGLYRFSFNIIYRYTICIVYKKDDDAYTMYYRFNNILIAGWVTDHHSSFLWYLNEWKIYYAK